MSERRDATLQYLRELSERLSGAYKQVEIAKLIGYTPASVNYHINNPEKMSDRFIKLVAQNVPGFAEVWSEYQVLENDELVPLGQAEIRDFKQVIDMLEGQLQTGLEAVAKMRRRIDRADPPEEPHDPDPQKGKRVVA